MAMSSESRAERNDYIPPTLVLSPQAVKGGRDDNIIMNEQLATNLDFFPSLCHRLTQAPRLLLQVQSASQPASQSVTTSTTTPK